MKKYFYYFHKERDETAVLYRANYNEQRITLNKADPEEHTYHAELGEAKVAMSKAGFIECSKRFYEETKAMHDWQREQGYIS